MKLSRIYLDKSVIGGCHDKEFAPWSNGLMKDFRLRNYIPVISDLTFEELAKTPKPIKQTLKKLVEYDPEIIEINDDALTLAEIYLERKILTSKYRVDARHIALESLANVDVLVDLKHENKHIRDGYATSILSITIRFVYLKTLKKEVLQPRENSYLIRKLSKPESNRFLV